MSSIPNDFFHSNEDQPHRQRSKAIIKAHPEIAKLMGPEPATFLVLLFVVGLQVAMAYVCGQIIGPDYWWAAIVLAWVIGAFANHSLYVIIHEATHNLIFKKRLYNKIAGVLADMPNVFPAAMGFRVYHIKHHAHQGDHEYDADMANHWEAKLVGNSSIMKALWLLLFPFFQMTRPPRLKINMWNPWIFINLAVSLTFDIALFYFTGWVGFLYIVCSFFFSIGLHPVGARWIQEHYTLNEEEETFSYYGPFNILALNVGYHNEHHDFPFVAWTRLPQVKKMAPEFYDHLPHHKSWTKLWLTFIFDSRYTLFSRVERKESGKVSFSKAQATEAQEWVENEA